MTAKIESLIQARDTSEIVRDEIAAILLTESTRQQELAVAAGLDPYPWKLRVFLDRSNPWSEFVDSPDNETDGAVPIVNVAFDQATYDKGKSNIVERQNATATYNVDCYGYGKAADSFDGGHTPGDFKAATEAMRTKRLVRQILMSAHYAYLGQPKSPDRLVWQRWLQSEAAFLPPQNERVSQHVRAMRLQFQIQYNEFSPQVEPTTIDLLAVALKRSETGEVFLTADY